MSAEPFCNVKECPVGIDQNRELCNRWQVSKATLERWRSEGIGPIYVKLGGQVRYRQEDVLEYEASCLRRSTFEAV
ncbi:helix-turn-helix domain-containing protein [Neptunomonas phycophila]|uniref:Helix-turn-helix domain-containing protein n=1 Tax=Neptunomonas phycophila TaxID=1572645 RepID=A0AAW7XI08_9GAMM|nr:helix-turn-helix domain-containing protein [Neptunomonas phycophila]MDO6453861.1 helix-turn-helix domain-containing protein [Neptunomonas phycophila]